MNRLFILFITLFIPLLTIGADDFPDERLTVPEKSEFRAPLSHGHNMAYLHKL